MNWYLAKIVYRIICGDGDHVPQFDEQLRLIEAEDGLHAFNKAQAIGEREQHTFLNEQRKTVQWKFINVSELHALDRLTDGAEIYSHIKEEEDGDIYAHMTNVRAAHLLDKHSNEFIESL